MTPVWHDGPLDALVWDGQSPIAWSVAESGPYAAGLPGDARAIRHGLAVALIRKLAGDSDDVRLTRSAAGAPIVSAPGGWYLSLSSRGAHALIGVARQPIAVDLDLVLVVDARVLDLVVRNIKFLVGDVGHRDLLLTAATNESQANDD